MAVSALQPLKNLNASHNGVLAKEGYALSFRALHSRLITFHDDDLNHSHVKQTALKTNGNFYCTTWEGTWVKTLSNGLPTQ